MSSEMQELSSLSVHGLLGMLQSNQSAVVTEVLTHIKQEFPKVKDKWLINGLVDYYFYSKSQKLLDLIISADSHHSRYLMENIIDGLKHKDKFSYTTLLLYAVSKEPLPVWVYKIPDHQITKELLLAIDPYREKDSSVIVSALMIFVILLPAMPQSFISHLSKLLETFGLLLHHPPPKNDIKYYLQIAICCFFQRLYGLFPNRLVAFLRHQHSVKPSTLGWYEKTLFPMLEKVRFHPLLITELKESQSCNRWQNKSRADLLQECAQFSLDPYFESPDSVSFSLNFIRGSNSSSSLVNGSGFHSSDNKAFYAITRSKSINSKSSTSTSYTSLANESLNDILTETAEEAIPDGVLSEHTTPRMKNGHLNVPSKDDQNRRNPNWLSTSLRKLSNSNSQDNFSSQTTAYGTKNDQQNRAEDEPSKISMEKARLRKASVYEDIEFDRKDFETSISIDPIEEEEDFIEEDPQDSEGLGMPSHSSWTELLKTVHTKRLRFLSQCGPPPDLSSLAGSLSTSPTSPVKPLSKFDPDSIRKSKSFPNLGNTLRATVAPYVAPIVQSPVRIPVESVEVTTQTEEVDVIDPYEQLLKSIIRIPKELKEEQSKLELEPTPQELLDMVIKNELDTDGVTGCKSPANRSMDAKTKLAYKQQLRSLHSLYKMEQFKKEVFARRNKQLSSQIFSVMSQFERSKASNARREFLENENKELKAKVQELEKRNQMQELKLKESTDLSGLKLCQGAKESLEKERDSADELCRSLQEAKLSLDIRINNVESELQEACRQLKCQRKLSVSNKALRKHVHTLNKQVLVLGELALHIDNRLSIHRNPEQNPMAFELELLREQLAKDAALLEERNMEFSNDYIAAHYHVQQLQKELAEQKEIIKSKQAQLDQKDLIWQERCTLLQKRNKELSCLAADLDSDKYQVHMVASQPIDVPGAKSYSIICGNSLNPAWAHSQL